MAVTTTKTNKPLNPRGNDQSPKGYNRAELYTGKALDFDGVNDYVEVTNITDTYKSYVLYFNSDNDITSSSSYSRMFGVYSSYYGLNTGASTGSLTNETLTMIPDGSSRTATTMDFVGGVWYQVALLWNEDESYFDIYINAQNKTDLSTGTHTLSAASSLRLAKQLSGTGTLFNGKIANFKAFSTALTAAQVADLYNNPEKIVPTGVSNDALKLWLPMQEGAGTTAYDGSGNGNHGTISGATWQHGIGAPVAQTAVIDWNKQSYFAGNGGDDTYFTSSFADFNGQTAVTMYAEFVWQGITGNQNILDWGGNNGLRVRIEGTNDYFQVLQKGGSNIMTSTTAATENAFARIAARSDSNGLKLFLNGSEIASNSTAIDSTASSTGFYIGRYAHSAAEYFNGIIPEAKVWTSSLTDAQLESLTAGTTNPEDYTSGAVAHWTGASEYEDQVGSYDLTAIGSPVRFLASQGLTGGRDIFNALFNNVRKQGALNLDGNSWAEVHDNASLDFGTEAFSLEAWRFKLSIKDGRKYYNLSRWRTY